MSTTPRQRTLIVASAAVALIAVGTVPVALASGSARPKPAAETNLALGRPVTGSSPCRAEEDAAKAVNGAFSGLRDKWCSGAAAKSVTVDLGSGGSLSRIVVRHASAGGEKAAYNTRDFDLSVSMDGVAFNAVANVRGNTAGMTVHSTGAPARFVRLTVLRAEQAGTGGAARIYELEVYRPDVPPPPSASPSPVPSVSPVPSPSPAASPSPVPSPAKPPTPDPLPPPATGSCFPYPAHDASKPPNTKVVVKPDVPAMGQKYLDAAGQRFVQQWPGTWQTFATARDLRDPSAGVNQAILQTSTRPGFGDGTIEIPYKDFMDSVDRGDSGMWIHESAHLLGTGLPYPNVPKFYGEGIPDFVRFAALGEEPGWKFINATDASYFDKDKVWTDGYRQAARFLLWVTQHYDKSGDRYKLVHDLNEQASVDNPDWTGLFVKLTGKTYDQLFAEYSADRKVNPHC